ncbi:transglycosylase SLT domain-containing protein [Halosquirtibacter xylanolyticus]|uniref:lytic transglycosylase domain-containing protein n=1 Tax=Halosquirtibacter xylanolyticus TaxID=3374599 RepID=UPI003748D08F|nr:transglycosylase SLT domain-containing protein [Prolixibacteraceae bacterium]
MKLYILLFISLFISFSPVTANDYNKSKSVDADSLQRIKIKSVDKLDFDGTYQWSYVKVDEDLSDIFTDRLDSMVIQWRTNCLTSFEPLNQDTINGLDHVIDESEVLKGMLSDSVYIKQFENINSFIDLSYNGTVKNFVNLYAVRRKRQIANLLQLSEYYFPMFEEVLDRYDMPLELKYLPIIESSLNPRAYSRAGASGLWQFMYHTGKQYKLRINSYVDERRDPYKASEAAAKFLKDLYSIYKDWHLVIAAYNCGPGNVNKAIRRCGGARNYWEIYYRLPRETRGYVPSFIAATYIMNYADEYGITPNKRVLPLATDTITVDHYLHLQQVATKMNIPIDMIRELNPQYRKDVIPATATDTYMLRLPAERVGDFIDQESHIYALDRNKYFPNNRLMKPKSLGSSKYAHGDIKGKKKVYYKVKNGDNVGYIAEWFHVRSSDLRYWNNIRRNMIRVGQKLVIYVPASKYSYYKGFNTKSFTQKQQAIGARGYRNKTASSSKSSSGKYVYYTVKKNDTLWKIAKKYNGVTESSIKSLNSIRNARSLSIGQTIKIKKI